MNYLEMPGNRASRRIGWIDKGMAAGHGSLIIIGSYLRYTASPFHFERSNRRRSVLSREIVRVPPCGLPRLSWKRRTYVVIV